MTTPVITTARDMIPLPLFRQGKVRETFELGDHLLMVATDRISAYDSILPNGIPNKGIVLTQLSRFWFDRTSAFVPNHLIDASVAGLPDEVAPVHDQLAGRTMVVRKAERVEIECVARGYLSGSGWAEYRTSGEVCGIRLPGGLVESDQLPEPIFTPAMKADAGHDENISFERMSDLIGRDLSERLRELTLRVYQVAEEYARTRGSIIIADTKLEFGFIDGELSIIDELLTPDSSRFWDIERYSPGGPQASYDKQFVRDWLNSSGWDREPPPPQLPDDIVQATSGKYQDAYERLTGKPLFPLS